VQKQIEAMVAAHRSLKSFAADVQFVVNQRGKIQNATGSIAYASPNKYAIRSEMVAGEQKSNYIAVSDGKTASLAGTMLKNKYLQDKVDADNTNIARAIGMSGAGSGLLPLILSDPNAIKQVLPPGITKSAVGPDETVNGVTCRILHVAGGPEGKPQYDYEFAIGKTDNLLRRVKLSLVGGEGNNAFSMTESYTNIKQDPTFSPRIFAFTPPPGATKTTTEELESSQPKPYDERLKVGAAPLPFSGTDLNGKTINLEQYKGKVVLVDFWATWCGPCIGELPTVTKAYNQYKDKGFDIIGVSLDEADDKAKLTKFVAENKMPWPQIYDGKGWEAGLAKAYGVRAIPFTLLIGRDGKIAAVNPRGNALAPAIEAALK
jgi:peroxiredoxin/outer membrane lipoprotein-sorting protein